MSDFEAHGGAGDAQVMAVADFIQGLEHQLARLTRIMQNGVELGTVDIEERESV